jgi:hypothetical protein
MLIRSTCGSSACTQLKPRATFVRAGAEQRSRLARHVSSSAPGSRGFASSEFVLADMFALASQVSFNSRSQKTTMHSHRRGSRNGPSDYTDLTRCLSKVRVNNTTGDQCLGRSSRFANSISRALVVRTAVNVGHRPFIAFFRGGESLGSRDSNRVVRNHRVHEGIVP